MFPQSLPKMDGTYVRRKAERNTTGPLATCYNQLRDCPEIGVDEAGKGPMFGRVYAAAACLPKDTDNFPHGLMKDSKRFHSTKKIQMAYNAIKSSANAWSVAFEEASTIDQINIRQATFRAMHRCILDVVSQLKKSNLSKEAFLIIDGNDFAPITKVENGSFVHYDFACVEGGDNKYTSVAAASILAKVDRDAYIQSICESYPLLDSYYGLLRNKGYGTASHMAGLQEHGLSPWHRKTYGVCKSLYCSDEFTDCTFN